MNKQKRKQLEKILKEHDCQLSVDSLIEEDKKCMCQEIREELRRISFAEMYLRQFTKYGFQF